MSEAETGAELIDPALKAAGWGTVEGSRILLEYRIAPGRIEGHGRKPKPVIADYILFYRNANHNSIADALADLGRADEIGSVFSGFQKCLCCESAVA